MVGIVASVDEHCKLVGELFFQVGEALVLFGEALVLFGNTLVSSLELPLLRDEESDEPLGVVAAVAVYALVQRSDARHQAAIAESRRVVALREKSSAEHATREAVQQKKAAKHNAAIETKSDGGKNG